MNATAYITCYLCAGIFALAMTHLIRVRLKANHAEVYKRLRSPTSQDSNLTAPPWGFAQFIWWRLKHRGRSGQYRDGEKYA
jgi:hypothetical protein